MLMRDPVPLTDDAIDDITSYLRIETHDDDALIANLIVSALQSSESFCGQMLIERNVTEQMSARRDWKPLGAVPVTAIAQIDLQAADGTSKALSPGQYGVDIDAEGRGWVRINDMAVQGRIAIHYRAGLAASWGAIPEAIRQGIIRLVGYFYTSRDAADDSGPPAAVAALLRPWRRMRLSGLRLS